MSLHITAAQLLAAAAIVAVAADHGRPHLHRLADALTEEAARLTPREDTDHD